MIHEEITQFPTWFSVLEPLTFIALLVFTIVSFFVYFVEIHIIFLCRNSTFKGPFYRLMFVGVIVDILSAINLFTGQIVPAQGWFSSFLIANQNLLGAIFFLVTYGGRCVQGATAAILSFCRVCAVCFPIFYQRLCRLNYIYTMQFFQLIGVPVAAVMLLPENYEFIYENGGYYSVSSDEGDADWFYNFVALLEVFFVLVIVINNLITYLVYRKKFQNNSTRDRPDRSLDKMTFLVCCLELIYFSFVVYSLLINPNMNKRIFYFLYNILCVIYSTFSAWMLLVFSKPIKNQFRQKFRKRSRSISVSF